MDTPSAENGDAAEFGCKVEGSVGQDVEIVVEVPSAGFWYDMYLVLYTTRALKVGRGRIRRCKLYSF